MERLARERRARDREAAEQAYRERVPEANDFPAEDNEYEDGVVREVCPRRVESSVGRVRIPRDITPTIGVGDHLRVYGTEWHDEQDQPLPEKKCRHGSRHERARGVFVNGKRVRYTPPIPPTPEEREWSRLMAMIQALSRAMYERAKPGLDERIANLPPPLRDRMPAYRKRWEEYPTLEREREELSVCEEAARLMATWRSRGSKEPVEAQEAEPERPCAGASTPLTPNLHDRAFRLALAMTWMEGELLPFRDGSV